MPRIPQQPDPPQQPDEADELMTVGDAQRYLGIGHSKMSKLIATGKLEVVGRDELDNRVKLVRRRDVEKLLSASSKSIAAA
jgi:hypothetical protein